MDYKLRTSQAAVAQFLKTMNADDEAFLVEFSDTARVSVGFTTNTPRDSGCAEESATRRADGDARRYQHGAAEMKKAKNSRKAIVIISDGGDNHSQYTPAEIESLVREADVQIYAMGVFEPTCLSACPRKRSRDRNYYPKLRRKPAGGLSRQRSPATCRVSRPGLRSNCGINTYSAITRRIKRGTESTGRVEVKLTQPKGRFTAQGALAARLLRSVNNFESDD